MDREASCKSTKPTAVPRGRPIKTNSQDSAAERRRVQVRVNQRHLRQRRQNAQEALQQKLRNLQGAVESVSDAFITLNDVLVGTGLTAAHLEIATSLRETLDKVVELAREALEESEDTETTPGKCAQELRSPLILFLPRSPDRLDNAHPYSLLKTVILGGTTPPTTALTLQHRSQSLFFGSPQPPLIVPPRITLRDRIVQKTAANAAFQEQAKTMARAPPSFAMLLAFNTVLHGYRLLADRGVFDNEEARSMFSLRARFESFHDIIDSVRKGLYFYLQYATLPDCSFGNVIGMPVPSWEELTATTKPFRDVSVEKSWVSQAIEANLSQTGLCAEDFMDPWVVERYLKENWASQLGVTSFPSSSTTHQSDPSILRPTEAAIDSPVRASAFMTPRPQFVSAAEVEFGGPLLTNTYSGGSSSENLGFSWRNPIQRFSQLVHDNDIHVLVQQLVKASICFGSEPRWSKEVVDSVVEGFIQDRQVRRAKRANSLSPNSAWFTLRVAS